MTKKFSVRLNLECWIFSPEFPVLGLGPPSDHVQTLMDPSLDMH